MNQEPIDDLEIWVERFSSKIGDTVYELGARLAETCDPGLPKGSLDAIRWRIQCIVLLTIHSVTRVRIRETDPNVGPLLVIATISVIAKRIADVEGHYLALDGVVKIPESRSALVRSLGTESPHILSLISECVSSRFHGYLDDYAVGMKRALNTSDWHLYEKVVERCCAEGLGRDLTDQDLGMVIVTSIEAMPMFIYISNLVSKFPNWDISRTKE